MSRTISPEITGFGHIDVRLSIHCIDNAPSHYVVALIKDHGLSGRE